jgi:hypothetical protein
MTTLLPLRGHVAYRLGRTLPFDPIKGTCIDDREADRLLFPCYWNLCAIPEPVSGESQKSFPNGCPLETASFVKHRQSL